MSKKELPETFYVKCIGEGSSGVVYGNIVESPSHPFGGRAVAFGGQSYRVRDEQTVEIHRSSTWLGTHFFLVDGPKTYRISIFDLK